MIGLSAAVLLLCVFNSEAQVTLNRLASMKMPSFDGSFAINGARTIAGAYDSVHGLMYVAGRSSRQIHMVNVLSLQSGAMTIIGTEELAATESLVTDIKICGTQVAISTVPSNRLENGHVLFYPLWTLTSTWGTPTHRVAVGAFPKSLKWNGDCSRVVVANEGPIAPGLLGIGWEDPEGSITDIQFVGGNPSVTNLDFIQFNAAPPSNIRHVFTNALSSFSRDMEPEHVTIDQAGHFAYVTLQENNAMMRVSLLGGPSFSDFTTFSTKSWQNSFLDPADNTRFERFEFDIHSLYQPDEVEAFDNAGTTYLVTLGEGASRSYNELEDNIEYSDATPGSVLVQSQTVNITIGTELVDALVNDDRLGRTHISNSDGLDASGTAVNMLHIFGSRSMSIWRASPFSLLSDSDDKLEQYLHDAYPNVFNTALYDDLNVSPDGAMDRTSNSYGPELQGLALGEHVSKNMIIFGAKQIGAIFLYSISDLTPMFESVHRTGSGAQTWTQLYAADTTGANIGDAGIQQIGYIHRDDSPTGEAVIYVISDVSGTLSFYEFFGS